MLMLLFFLVVGHGSFKWTLQSFKVCNLEK
jgi:hypothetical protein